jgi:hypothetical protein
VPGPARRPQFRRRNAVAQLRRAGLLETGVPVLACEAEAAPLSTVPAGTTLSGQDLPQWTGTAREAGLPGIATFAKGLDQDPGAAASGLAMPWSSGPVEGRVNRR